MSNLVERRLLYATRRSNGMCVRCGKNKATDGVLCSVHGKERTKLNRKRHEKLIPYRDCRDCGKKLDDTRVTRCSACLIVNKVSAGLYRKKTHATRLAYGRQIREGVKDEVFRAYGGWICKCCGITEHEFLSLDHIHGGGNAQRKANRLQNGYTFYCWLKKNNFPPGYQVLCMNCNFAKRYTMVCPHQKENRFVVTLSGNVGNQSGVLDVEKAASALGKICRYAGNCRTFWSVLQHSLVVEDLAPDRIKLLALVHDVSETAISDVPSPFKVPELENIEKKIQNRLYESLGLTPTKEDLEDLKTADRRALRGEVWTLGGDELRRFYPERDLEAEEIVMRYVHRFVPQDTLQSDGRAVIEFVRRFRNLHK